MPKITIKVDPNLCIGAAACVTVSPSTFQLNDENKADVLGEDGEQEARVYEREREVTHEQLEEIKLAAESCPVRAIFLYDEDGNEL